MGIERYKESLKGAVYHIYNRGNRKGIIFKENDDFEFYLSRLKKCLKKYDFSLIAYCLMPNHIHLLLKQNEEYTPSKLMLSLHTSYSMTFNKKYGTVGHIFQGRYKQRIVKENNYLQVVVVYIHENPVKAGYAPEIKLYPWSSASEFLTIQRGGLGVYCDRSLIKDLGLSINSAERDFENYYLLGQV